MNLNTRLARLEKHRDQHPPDCAGCGYPSKAVQRVIACRTQEPLPTCTVCAHPLDHQGRPMHVPFTRISRGDRAFSRSS
jgi:hypothetical protein